MNSCNNPNYGALQGRLGSSVNVCTQEQIGGCGQTTKQLAPIPNIVGQIKALLCELHGSLDNLTGALVSVTAPLPCETPDGKCAAPRPSGLIGELEELRDGVSSAVRRVQEAQKGLLI